MAEIKVDVIAGIALRMKEPRYANLDWSKIAAAAFVAAMDAVRDPSYNAFESIRDDLEHMIKEQEEENRK